MTRKQELLAVWEERIARVVADVGGVISAAEAAEYERVKRDADREAANAYPTLVAELVKVRAELVVVDNLYDAATTQRDALLEAAQALVENPRPSAFARNRLRTAIATATGEKE